VRDRVQRLASLGGIIAAALPTYETLLYDIENNVLTITLNRPDRLNAFTPEMGTEIIDALDHADADDGVRAIIFTGAGRAYCAGADLSSGGDTFDSSSADVSSDPDRIHRDGGGLVSLRIYDCLKPTIAAINGAAVGVGVTSTLPMDIRIASENARFGFVFARRGIVPEACSSWFLPRVVGISRATEWCYTGEVFDAEEALDGRLVRSVVPADELIPTARALAESIARNTSAVSVSLTRHMMWRLLGADHPMEAHKLDSRGVQYMGGTADAREGVESFLEKREPDYQLSPSSDMPPYFPWWVDPEFS
jgi:enoyl-CoA hydratase/carnithine racemase